MQKKSRSTTISIKSILLVITAIFTINSASKQTNSTKNPIFGESAILLRNLLLYSLGGVIIPFIGIKELDLVLSLFI